MLPVPADVLKRLRLGQALEHEAGSWQSLLPPAPGWDGIMANSSEFVQWMTGQLRAGMPTAPQLVVTARKPQHGVRPVPVWGFAERVAYRALVDFLLRNEPPPDRSPEAYLDFIGGPVQYARDSEPSPEGFQGFSGVQVGSSLIHYVVKADITAFYDYVDQGILSRELLARTGDYAAIECLISLLADMQGRVYGLPQLLDPSDRLADVYIDIVERDVLRRGWPTWRFNDDFRIAARDFGDALAAIEDLAVAARDVGLTLSDVKTTTPRFTTHARENFDLQVDDELPAELRRHDPEDFVGDYTEGVGEGDPVWASEIIAKSYPPDAPTEQRSEEGINLGKVRVGDLRHLRRALGRLIRAGIAEALPHVTKLVIYAPSLTPWAMRYVGAAGLHDPGEAAGVLGALVDNVSLSDWQRMWIARTIDELGLLQSDAPGNPSELRAWLTNLMHGRHNPIVAAEATMALAGIHGVDFADVEYRLRNEPAALATWYLTAINRLRTQGDVTEQQYTAVRGEAGLYAAVLGAVA